jgi:hypothetical protein
MKKITTLIYFIFLLFSSFDGMTQNDTLKNEYQKEFDDFLNSSQQEFNTFQSKNDSIFYGFLKQNWKEYKTMEKTRSEIPKPEEQPVIKPTKKSIDTEIKSAGEQKTIMEDSGRQIRYNNVPDNYNKVDYIPNYTRLNFYGAIVKIPKAEFESYSTEPVNQNEIAEYFKNNAGNKSFLKVVDVLKTASSYRKLNGYGYLRLLQHAAAHYYNKTNDQVLFTWLALLKSGYDTKVGYSNQNVYLLVCFDTQVFYYSYFENSGKRYYLIPFAGQNKLNQPVTSFPENYPGDHNPVSLILNRSPEIPAKVETRSIYYKSDTVFLKYNQNLKLFYETYPDCDLSLYFPPAPSKIALSSLSDYLNPLLKGKSTIEQVNLLLDFMQKGFPYTTDEKQFGKEKYLFAEETIAYPYSDCEDRAILLSHLINYFTGLKTIGLVFPEHVSLAVQIPGGVDGAYVEYNNQKYYICDPTYIGSKLGMIMPEYAKSNPEIISFERNYKSN